MNSRSACRVDPVCITSHKPLVNGPDNAKLIIEKRTVYNDRQTACFMKTNFRLWALVIGVSNMALWVGCQENQAQGRESLLAVASPSLAANADEPKPAAVPAKPAEAPVPVVIKEAVTLEQADPSAAPAVPAPIIITKVPSTNPPAAVSTNVAVVAPATAPAEPPRVSPALAEVVRLIQANVNQDILLAYITNSTQPFYIGANEIVYLHDLGAPAAVVTSLINIDASPEMQSRKQIAIAAKPLPPGVALAEPVPNIFPSRATAQNAANPPEPTPVNPPSNAGSTALSPPPPDTTVTYDYPQPSTEVNYSYFYSSLSPYGSWSDVPGYGSCWRPTCATWNSSWRPYSDGGRWLWSDHGWYWYSDYSWGWAPFHYGRWCQPAGYGWVWQPDTYWGPSWVSWRYSPNYCGWAPLPPSARYVSGLGFYYNSGSVGIGFEFGLSAADYCYVPSGRFCDSRVRNYCLPPHQNQIVHKDTTVINNYVVGNNNQIVNNGVGVDKIARVTRGDIKRVALRDTSSMKNLGTRHDRLEADGSTLTVYRPPATTLARKSVVALSGQPAVSVSRPLSVVRPGTAVRNSAVAPSAPAGSGVKSYVNPGVGNSRTTPSPVTLYTRPAAAANEPVIVTGGVVPSISHAKPEAQSSAAGSRVERSGVESPRFTKPNVAGEVRQHEAAGLNEAAGSVRPSSAYSKPVARSSAAGHVSPVPAGDNSSRIPAKPPASGAPSPGYTAPSKSGYTRGEPAPNYAKPVSPQPSAVQNSAPGYSQPATVAPSRGPSYATPSAGYVAPSRSEAHHSQVAAPAIGPSGGGGPSVSSGSGSGSSGGSHGKSSDSSGDNRKGR